MNRPASFGGWEGEGRAVTAVEKRALFQFQEEGVHAGVFTSMDSCEGMRGCERPMRSTGRSGSSDDRQAPFRMCAV